MLRSRYSIAASMVAIAIAAACSGNPVGPGHDRPALGIISWEEAPAEFLSLAGVYHDTRWSDGVWGDWPPLVAPNSVRRGVPFTARITTPLPNGCWYPGEHEKALGAVIATITAYDHRTVAENCTQLFGWHSREIELRFDEPGEAIIRLVGRRVTGEDIEGGEELVLEHTVIVE